MPLRRFALVALMPLALVACNVPDLVAHGVKSYERNQDANRNAANTAASPASQPAPAIQPVAVPEREAVTAEPLR